MTSPAYAAAPADDEFYPHPLLEEGSTEALGALGYLDAEDVFSRLDVFDSITMDEDGVAIMGSGARLANVTFDPDVFTPEEPFQEAVIASPGLEDLLERDPSSGEPVELWIALRSDEWEQGPPIAVQEQLAMIDGLVLTWGDHRAFRAAAMMERTEAGLAALEPLLVSVEALGGEVLATVGFTAQARIRIPINAIRELLEDPLLGTIDEPQVATDDAGHAWTVTGTDITGYEAEDLLQSTQFYDRGYEGEDEIGQVEGSGDNVYNGHPGLKDSAGNKRVANCFWLGGACVGTYPLSAGEHSTAVASVLVGDITHGQDASILNIGTNRRARSGVARTSETTGTASDSNLSTPLSIYTSGNYPIDLLNMSASYYSDDTSCNGTGTISQNADAFYEAGIAFFKSAGNQGNRSTSTCTVGSPGSAMGVFPVAAYYINSSDNEEIYDASSTSGSSRGGAGTMGRGRTIIGMAGPGLWQYPYAYSSTLTDGSGNPLKYGTDWAGTSASGPENFCCTSSSTPAVAGSASIFRDWYHGVYGTGVDDPGKLYVNMLLMGDRTEEGGTRMTKDFDGLWGAGKLRLRAFDSTGLDGPMSWSTGSTCVANGATVTVNVGSSVLDSDVDVIRAAIWWYDSRFDDNVAHDNINLRLSYDNGGTDTLVVLANSTDNRQRIHKVPTVSGVQYKIKMIGNSVTNDVSGCGTNSMLVYYAYFTEDSDRESVENLSYIRTE